MPNLTDEFEQQLQQQAYHRRFVTLREIMITLAGLVLVVLTLLLGRASAMVVLITATNDTLPFPDMEAAFAPSVPGAGISGGFYAVSPLDACHPIINGPPPGASEPTFALIERGTCKFDTKVLHAQAAGFAAAIIFNNEDNHDLVTMSGSEDNIHIPAVFVAKSAGEALIAYSKEVGAKVFIVPAYENTAWSVMAVSFISLLAVTAVLTTFLFVRRYRLRRLGSRILSFRESLSMTSREVKSLPTIVFKSVAESATETCAICLEDYEPGEKLRVLPCHHNFHAHCVDLWLTTRRPFCPVCKRDAHTKIDEPPPTESTPLLASVSPLSGTLPAPVAVPSTPAATQTSPVNSPRHHVIDVEAASTSSTSSSPVGSPAVATQSTTNALAFHSAPGGNAFLHNAGSAPHGDELC